MMDIEKWKYAYYSFVETFVEEQYRWLSMGLKEHTTVFDLGAQAGDSAFYLLNNNEDKIDKIYAYEPDADLENVYKIQLEYHGGPKDLPSILGSKGFEVTTVGPWKIDENLGEVG